MNGHEYDEDNTYWYRGYRQCKACRLIPVSWSPGGVTGTKRLAEHKEWSEANREQWLRREMKAWVKARILSDPSMLHRLKKQRQPAGDVLTESPTGNSVLKVYGNACLACDKAETTIDHVIPVLKAARTRSTTSSRAAGLVNASKGVKTIDYRPAPLSELLALAG